MKKGQAQNFFMVITIIAVLSLVVGIILFVNLGGKVQEDQEINDAFCKSKISTLSDKLEPEAGNDLSDRLLTLMEAFRASCTPQSNVIDPQNWDACDSSFKSLSITDPTTAATYCTMQQVADRVERCWDMSGEGRLTAFSWACFNIVISEASETPEISEHKDFQNQIIKTFNCPLLDSKEQSNPVTKCKENARASIEPATRLAGYNNIMDISEGSIKGTVESCRKTEIDEDLEEFSDEWTYQNELLNKRVEEIYLEFNLNNVREILSKYTRDEIITYGDQEFDCTLIVTVPEVESSLETIEQLSIAAKPYETEVLRNYNLAKGSELTELPFQLKRDTRLETNTIQFTERELKTFMKDVPIQGRVINYCNSISYRGKNCDNRLEYYPQGFKVKQNKLFSVEYCGDALPFGASLVASSVCERGEDQRRILISDIPTGGGSRLINENLKYNCPIIETAASIDLPLIDVPYADSALEAAKDTCQTGVVNILSA